MFVLLNLGLLGLREKVSALYSWFLTRKQRSFSSRKFFRGCDRVLLPRKLKILVGCIGQTLFHAKIGSQGYRVILLVLRKVKIINEAVFFTRTLDGWKFSHMFLPLAVLYLLEGWALYHKYFKLDPSLDGIGPLFHLLCTLNLLQGLQLPPAPEVIVAGRSRGSAVKTGSDFYWLLLFSLDVFDDL